MRRLMMEPDAAPAGGRRTLLPSTRAAPGLRPAANTSLPARSWLTVRGVCRLPETLTVNGYSQGAGARRERPARCSAETKARPGAASPFPTMGEAEEDGRK